MVKKIAGIDLVRDAKALASRYLKADIDTKRSLLAARPGFQDTAKDERAVNSGCFLLDGYVRRYVNPQSGASEIVYYGNGVQRVVYNSDNVPVGAIQINKSQDGTHFDAYVLEAGENAEIMQVQTDGTRRLFRSPGNFFKEFDINNIGALVSDAKGNFTYKFFGK